MNTYDKRALEDIFSFLELEDYELEYFDPSADGWSRIFSINDTDCPFRWRHPKTHAASKKTFDTTDDLLADAYQFNKSRQPLSVALFEDDSDEYAVPLKHSCYYTSKPLSLRPLFITGKALYLYDSAFHDMRRRDAIIYLAADLAIGIWHRTGSSGEPCIYVRHWQDAARLVDICPWCFGLPDPLGRLTNRDNKVEETNNG